MNQLTPDNLDEYAAPVESTRMVLTPDKEGMVLGSYEFETGAAGGSAFWVTPEIKAGEYQIGGYSYSENALADLVIDVYVLNEDGTVTYVVYRPKL